MGFLGLGGIIGGIGSLLGGLFGSNASSKASQQYVQALQQAQKWMEGQEQQGLQNYQPYLGAGSGAATTLSSLMGTPGQGLLTPWTQQFTAPTAAQAEATPGYQFQLKQGLNAAQNSAAGNGSLLTGRTLADLNNYAQGVASTNYQDVFNNALTQYNSAYNTFLNNQNNTYARLMGLSGQGLQAAQGAGGLISGIGGDIASLMGQQGAARAAGTLGSANTWSSEIGGAANSIGGGLTLGSLLGNSGTFSSFADPSLSIMQPSYMPGGGSFSAPYSPTALPGGYGSTPPMSLSALMNPQMPQLATA